MPSKNDQLKADLDAITTKLVAANTAVQNAASALSAEKATNATLTQQVSAMTGQNVTLSQQVSTLQAQVVTLTADAISDANLQAATQLANGEFQIPQ